MTVIVGCITEMCAAIHTTVTKRMADIMTLNLQKNYVNGINKRSIHSCMDLFHNSSGWLRHCAQRKLPSASWPAVAFLSQGRGGCLVLAGGGSL